MRPLCSVPHFLMHRSHSNFTLPAYAAIKKKKRTEREREKQGKERHEKRNIFGAVFTGHALRVTDIENRGRGGGAPNEIKKMQKQKEQLETRQVKA